MAKQLLFQGAAVAIVTPMHEDLSINYDLFAQLIEEQIANQTDAIVVAGTTGEASTFSDEEHTEIIRFAVEQVKGRVPVIAGVGSNDTSYGVWLTKEAERVGADGLLHVTPYYNKTSQKGLFYHFKQMANATKLPIILYNVPSRTGMNITPQTAKKLSEISNIVAIKEASGNISQVAEIAALCGDDLAIYSGNDDQIVPVLALGGKGVISVLSNVCPKETHQICQAFFDGNTDLACKLQLQYLPLISALFSDVNPIPVKQAMCYMGKAVGQCRMPLCEMDDAKAIALLEVLKQYGLAAN